MDVELPFKDVCDQRLVLDHVFLAKMGFAEIVQLAGFGALVAGFVEFGAQEEGDEGQHVAGFLVNVPFPENLVYEADAGVEAQMGDFELGGEVFDPFDEGFAEMQR